MSSTASTIGGFLEIVVSVICHPEHFHHLVSLRELQALGGGESLAFIEDEGGLTGLLLVLLRLRDRGDEGDPAPRALVGEFRTG
jgi:hypothetical protein